MKLFDVTVKRMVPSKEDDPNSEKMEVIETYRDSYASSVDAVLEAQEMFPDHVTVKAKLAPVVEKEE